MSIKGIDNYAYACDARLKSQSFEKFKFEMKDEDQESCLL